MFAGAFFRTGLGLGLALELGCCWTCYKSAYYTSYSHVMSPECGVMSEMVGFILVISSGS